MAESDAQKVIRLTNQLEEIRKDCIAALKEKEVEAPANTTFMQLSTYIDQIVTG